MEIPGAYHDILNESDTYRLPAVGRIFSFLLDMQPIGR
jgi:alpha-beta hydrolase superfamily lysophospholipase